MKVLNLYAGIGGNRKLWTDVEVTAVELDPKIAEIYRDFFSGDKMIIGDAHQFLLDHFKEYDFIWSSPPCPAHSRARAWKAKGGLLEVKYPDMKLYEEIIFLSHFYDGLYCVENVRGYYEPLIKPQIVGKHYFWSNFIIRDIKTESKAHFDSTEDLQRVKTFDLSPYSGFRKDKVLRNCVEPKIGALVLDCARGNTQKTLVESINSKTKRINNES